MPFVEVASVFSPVGIVVIIQLAHLAVTEIAVPGMLITVGSTLVRAKVAARCAAIVVPALVVAAAHSAAAVTALLIAIIAGGCIASVAVIPVIPIETIIPARISKSLVALVVPLVLTHAMIAAVLAVLISVTVPVSIRASIGVSIVVPGSIAV